MRQYELRIHFLVVVIDQDHMSEYHLGKWDLSELVKNQKSPCI